MAHVINRPNCEKADSFSLSPCVDPCALHLIAKRSNGQAICEVVIGRNELREVLRYIREAGLDL